MVIYTRMRRICASLMLACALVQPAFSSVLLASAVTLALHGRDHAHSVALVSDDGHLDLVLSHADRSEDACRREPVHAHPHASPVPADHVIHVASDDATSTRSRKLSIDTAPPLAAPIASLPFPASLPAYDAPEQPRIRGAERIRTVVLQL